MTRSHALTAILLVAGLGVVACGEADPADQNSNDNSNSNVNGNTNAGCQQDCTLLGDGCNEGICVEGECQQQPLADGTACDDGLFCTTDDVCSAGVCSGAARSCPDAGECGVAVCNDDDDTCDVEPTNDGSACDDGDPCTGDGTCDSGVCAAGASLCGDLDSECAVGVCDPVAGCLSEPANEGGACDDGNACTGDGSCADGVCLAGQDVCASLDTECSLGGCVDPVTGCAATPVNEGAACDVSNPCASSLCQAGACVVDTPQNEGLACEDGLFCTFGDECVAGVCVPGVAAACPEDSPCGTWTCDEALQSCTLTPQNDGQACDDGNACTPAASSQCTAGYCAVPQPNGVRTYLWEDFADNSAGWALGPEWEIGPAQASTGGFPGNDPGFDHTPTADEGVAGVVIGGLASTEVHPFYYLTSPPMAVTPGDVVILGFYRWLNSDYDPFMHSSVEVWDGAQWVVLWISGPPPEISDNVWTYIEHDLTPYANDALRVRFGFDIGNAGVYTAGQWNIDDVLVSTVACP